VVIVSAPGNLFLSEEHVCVYTKTAFVVAPDLRTGVTVEPAGGGVTVISTSLGKAAKLPLPLTGFSGVSRALVPSFMLVEKVARDFDLELSPLKLTIDSQIPVGSGLSSSTALLVAGYFAVAEFLGAEPWRLTAEEVYERILPLQEHIHGKASGMEIFSSHLGGFNLLRGGELVSHYPSGEVACVVGDTGVGRSTKEVVAMVADWKEKHPEEAEELFSRISRITVEQEGAVDRGDWQAVGELMTENHRLLRRLGPRSRGRVGVSHPVLDHMVEAALRAGAYGAKLSGAGWGGVMFAICPPGRERAVALAVSRFGRVYPTKLGAEGVAGHY